MSNSFRHGLGLALALGAAAIAAAVLVYGLGRTNGKAACQAGQTRSQLQAQGQVIARAGADIQRSAAVGRAREADSAHVDAFFNRLAEEAHHATPDPVDRCVLPDERLRLWAAANAGPSAGGAAASEHDGGASAPAAAPFWARARLGGEPPRGGAPLSPADQPALPAAAAPAADAGGLPPLPPDR